MENSIDRPELRSLRIGEIFDRATTMYVRHFTVFTLIVLTLLAPIALLSYMILGERSTDFTQIITQIQHPGSASAAMAGRNTFFGAAALGMLSLLLAPYANNAVAVCVAAIYQGERADYRVAFRRVFARWWPLLGTIVLCALLLVGVYLAGAMIMFFLAALAAAIGGFNGPLAIAVIVICALLLVAALLAVFLVCVFALYATTLEGRRSGAAIAQAFGRLFTPREFGKAMLMLLAYFGLEIIAAIVIGTLDLTIQSLTHVAALELVFGTIANAVLNAYVTTMLAVYYFDVRTRVEGLDLETDIARLTSPA